MAIADISYFQGDIDWARASKQLDLVIIRVQSGSTFIDPKFKEYVAGAKQYGVPFGHYAYGKYVSIADAEVEAHDLLARADKDAKFLVIDAEELTVRSKAAGDEVAATQRFIDVCKEAGWKVGLYTGEYFYKNYGFSAIKADFYWIAKYSSNAPSIPFDLWQFTSSGHIDGINTNVDLNQAARDLSFFGVQPKVAAAQPAPVPAPVAAAPVVNIPATYTVQAGDNLSTIGARFGVAASTIQSLNGIKNANLIYAGQVLRLTASAPAPTPAPAVASYTYYKVQSGDTVSEIANRYGVSQQDIKAWNGLDAAYHIYIGQTLKVKKSLSPVALYHKVVSGDTVSELAVKYGTTSAQIRSWNGLDAAYHIFIGQKLRVK